MVMSLTLFLALPDAAYDETPCSDVESCDSLPVDTCEAHACGCETDHGDDNCCDTGCHHCSLPCCSGTAMIFTVAQVLGETLASDGRLAATSNDVPWVDADPPYHPPRG